MTMRIMNLEGYNDEEQALWQTLNAVYKSLSDRAKQIYGVIINEGFEASLGFFDGHFVRTKNNTFEKEHFPIPVIAIQHLCDIEIGLKYTSITTKLSRDDAFDFPFCQVFQTPFEAYGVENFQTDFYHHGMHLENLRKNIENSEESEIFFTFFHDKETHPEQILAFLSLLKKKGFFY